MSRTLLLKDGFFYLCYRFCFTSSIFVVTVGPGLILEQARKLDALCFALGLSYFASSEPGRLALIGMDLKRSSLKLMEKNGSHFESFFQHFTD